MEHFIRIFFWTVIFFTCLQGRFIPLVDSNIEYMRSKVTCLPNSTFYAPEVTEVTVECIPTALDCVMRELNGTVTQECHDPFGYIDSAVEFLELKIEDNLQKHRAPTTSGECECQTWSQTSFREFLDKMELLLQLEYAASVQ